MYLFKFNNRGRTRQDFNYMSFLPVFMQPMEIPLPTSNNSDLFLMCQNFFGPIGELVEAAG